MGGRDARRDDGMAISIRTREGDDGDGDYGGREAEDGGWNGDGVENGGGDGGGWSDKKIRQHRPDMLVALRPAVAPTAPDVDYPPSFDDEDDESDGSYESPTFHIDVRASIPRTHDDDDCDVRGGDDDDGDGSATTTTTTSTKGPCVG